MPKIDLQAIRDRAEAATPGPWEFGDGEYTGWIINPEEELIIGGNLCEGAIEDDDPNVIFIAHARTDIPALLDEVQELRADNLKGREKNAKLREIVSCQEAHIGILKNIVRNLTAQRQGCREEIHSLEAQLAAARAGTLEWVSYPDNVSKMYPELNPKIRPELGRWIIIEKAGNEERALDYFCLVCNEWVVLQKGDRWAYLPTPLEVME